MKAAGPRSRVACCDEVAMPCGRPEGAEIIARSRNSTVRLRSMPDRDETVPTSAPPTNWLGSGARVSTLLGRTDSFAVGLGAVQVYPCGLLADLRLVSRTGGLTPRPGVPPVHETSSVELRIRYADGQTGSLLPLPSLGDSNDDKDDYPGEILVLPREQHGGPYEWHQEIWVSPLPPEGPVTLTVASGPHGLEPSSVEIEGIELRS